MKQNKFPLAILVLMLLGAFAQISVAQTGQQLQQYIQQALSSNIALQQKELSYKKSLAALQEAKALFFPTLSLQARYSVAAGGRAFDLPLGDLMNPVYNNLNLINARNQSTNPDYPSIPAYPMLENESINFLRPTEQETKLRVVYPVFNAAIRNNHKIKKEMVTAESISVDIYKKELSKEVKVAYFNYAQAVEGVRLFENTEKLVAENLRTSKSLYKNHKVTVDVVYLAEAQLQSVAQQKAEAVKNEQVARAYFNFLLNREFDSPVLLDDMSAFAKSATTGTALSDARNNAFTNRDELDQIDQYLKISDRSIELQKGDFLPQVNLVGDYGIQGVNYSFGAEDDFAMGSVVLSWNIFNRPTRAKIEQAQIDRLTLQNQRAEVQQQIGLQVVSAWYDVEAATKNIDLAKAEKESTEKAFKLVDKKFKQGQANLVEWTESRTQMTNATQKEIIAKYNYQVKLAELERAKGL
ncbi:MAG: TolC family protein [Bacteroidota bacterium]